LWFSSSVQPARQFHSTANLPWRHRSSLLPSTLHARAPSWPHPSLTSALLLSQMSDLSSLQAPAPLQVSRTYLPPVQTMWDALSAQLPGVSEQASPACDRHAGRNESQRPRNAKAKLGTGESERMRIGGAHSRRKGRPKGLRGCSGAAASHSRRPEPAGREASRTGCAFALERCRGALVVKVGPHGGRHVVVSSACCRGSGCCRFGASCARSVFWHSGRALANAPRPDTRLRPR
jgi:hypothetical protein